MPPPQKHVVSAPPAAKKVAPKKKPKTTVKNLPKSTPPKQSNRPLVAKPKLLDSAAARQSNVLADFKAASGGPNGIREVVERVTFFKDIVGGGYTGFYMDPTPAYGDTTSHIQMDVPHHIEVDVLEPVIDIGIPATASSAKNNFMIIACVPVRPDSVTPDTNTIEAFAASYTEITCSQVPKWRRVLTASYKKMVEAGLSFIMIGDATKSLRQIFRIAIVNPDDGSFADVAIILQLRIRFVHATVIRPSAKILMGIAGALSTVAAAPTLTAGEDHAVFIEPLRIQNQV